MNGLACVPTNDAGVDQPGGTRVISILNPTISTQAAGSHLMDYRYGGIADSIFNPPYDALSGAWTARQEITNWSEPIGLFSSPVVAHLFQNNIVSGTQNANFNGFGNKVTPETISSYTNIWSPTQANTNIFTTTCFSLGDCVNLGGSVIDFGAQNANTDEGPHALSISGTQGYVEYGGTLVSPTTGTTTLTVSPTKGQGTQGDLRALYDVTKAYATGTCCTFSGTTGLVTVTGVGTAWTPSTNTTTSAAITVPGGGATQPGSVNVQVASSTGILVNDIVVIADATTYETVKVTAVPDGTHITAVFTLPHASGATVADASTAGTQAGNCLELVADTWTQNGNFAYWTAIQPIRQCWNVVSVTSATTLVYFQGSSAGGYTGAQASGGSNNLYPMALTVDVSNGGPTVSNTMTVEPNAVAWGNGDTVALALGPYFHFAPSFQNYVKFMPSQSFAAGGSVANYFGLWNGPDIFFGLNNNTALTAYSGHSGHFQAPLAFFPLQGLARYIINSQYFPDQAAIQLGCPVNATGTGANCSGNTQGNVLNVTSNVGGDSFVHFPNNPLGAWGYTDNASYTVDFPKGVQTSQTAGAMGVPLEPGWLTCTQANCASSPATVVAAQNTSLHRADISIACTAAVSTATVNVVITYTDVNTNSQTFTLGTPATCTTLASAAAIANLTQPFTPKTGTNIQYNVSTANAPTGYQVRVAIVQEGQN